MRAAAAIGIAFALAWGIGRIATDSSVATQWLHWIPTVVALLVSLVCVAVLVLRRAWRWARVLLVVAGVQVACVFAQDWHPWRSAPIPTVGERGVIRVAHFNANWPGASSARVAEALAAALDRSFQSTGADVLFLSERGDVLAAAALLGLVPDGVNPITVGRFAVISRIPILEARPLFDDLSSAAAVIRFEATESTPQWSAFLVDAPSDLRLSRVRVMEAIAARLATHSLGETDLLLGDFNAVRGGVASARVSGSMRHAFDEGGVGWGGTFPRAWPLWHLDQFYCGDRVDVLRYETVDLGIGQHRAQAATLRVWDTTPAALDP